MSHPPQPTAGSGQMFDQIAHRYDLLNRLMSFGLDQRWRRKLVKKLGLGESPEVLDIAAGTGDLTIELLKRHPKAQICALDPSAKMLQQAQRKFEARGISANTTIMEGDAHHLPFEDDRFDACVVAFGIRNFSDRLLALEEMHRVTRPGGSIAILELGEPRKGLLRWAARLHVHQLVPRIGSALSGSKEYRYLEKSIAAFPPPESFLELIGEAGFSELKVTALSFDSVHLYSGICPS